MAIVVFTGGARSGKSTAAENLAAERMSDGARVVALVFGRTQDDAEMTDRVARHREDRPDGFEVVEVERPDELLSGITDDSLVLLDCLGTLVGLVMDEEWPTADVEQELLHAEGELPPGYAERVESRVEALVSALCLRRGDTIIVTNEVGDGLVPAYASGRLFRDVVGRANRTLVNAADGAYLTVAGRLIDLSASNRSAKWPVD